MSNKIELLAPAGDIDSLHAAVENGADAVYLGGKLFNARQFAGNFDIQELKAAVEYAHIRGVNIYLTMNTLLSDDELYKALDFAKDAYLAGIDGIIVQDIGFASLLNKTIPDIPLHASTQMTIYNIEGIRALERMGFKRAVLARELSLEEIKYIAGNTSLEIEIFVHGALCISYSGQCLMSSIIGGRSGNRGKCAQPCRLKYKLIEQGRDSVDSGSSNANYLMSPKDLCAFPKLNEIFTSGVKSLKIEGRMKSPEYVATVVRIYRKYLDELEAKSQSSNFVDPKDMRDLAQIFNRGGFCSGYLEGKQGKDMMCYEKPKNWGVYIGETISYDKKEQMVKVRLEDTISMGDGIEVWTGEAESPGTIVTAIKLNGKNVKTAGKGDIAAIGNVNGNITKGCKIYKTSDKALNTFARESFSGKYHKRIMLYGIVTLKKGQPLMLKVYDSDGNESIVKSTVLPEEAENRPLSRERLAEQIKKTGSTPFEFKELRIELNDNLTIPVSEINDLRRRALDEIQSKRAEIKGRVVARDNNKVGDVSSHLRSADPKIALYFYNWDSDIDYSSLNADRLYLPFKALLDDSSKDIFTTCRKKGIEVFIWLPSITRGNYDKLIKKELNDINKHEIDGILTGNPGSIEISKEQTGIKISGDHTFNIFNSQSLEAVYAMGIDEIALSVELTLEQMCSIAKESGLGIEAIVYGRLPLMTSEYCPVGSIKGGHSSKAKCNTSCKRGEFRLKDRLGVEFPVICDNIDCRSTILNSSILFVPDALKKLRDSGVDVMRLYIWDEKPDMINKLVELHRDMAYGRSGEKYKELIEHIKSQGFTKGHYFRGV